MKTSITILMVQSVDGIISQQNGQSVSSWTSNADKERLKREIEDADVLIMGRRSFNVSFFKKFKMPIYVLTHDATLLTQPDDEHVHFTNISPTDLVSTMNKCGYKKVLLLGGQFTNTQFLLQGLVNDIKLTIEPKLFGAGLPFLGWVQTELNFKLISVEQANSNGTLFLHYKITNNRELRQNYMNSMKQSRSQTTALSDVLHINQNWWNERAKKHYTSKYYDIDKFLSGKNRIFEFEKEEMGDVKGKKLLHLQCHIGTETLSWARLGAEVTGVDFSIEALECATDLAKRASLSARFICSNIYDVLSHLNGEKFDIIYVNYGSIRWLDDINKWAKIVASLLKKGGFLYMHESHPISMALSSDSPTFVREYFYNKAQKWEEDGSYADGCENTKNNTEYGWERPLGETITAIANAGLQLNFLHERKGHVDKQFSYLELAKDGFWYPANGVPSIPATFTLKATKL